MTLYHGIKKIPDTGMVNIFKGFLLQQNQKGKKIQTSHSLQRVNAYHIFHTLESFLNVLKQNSRTGCFPMRGFGAGEKVFGLDAWLFAETQSIPSLALEMSHSHLLCLNRREVSNTATVGRVCVVSVLFLRVYKGN